MATQIELDYQRMLTYQRLRNNLEAVGELFRQGDTLIKTVNSILSDTRLKIDLGEETSFTKQDFDDMLAMRNLILTPIFYNASFAVQFETYFTTTTTTTEIPTTTTTE